MRRRKDDEQRRFLYMGMCMNVCCVKCVSVYVSMCAYVHLCMRVCGSVYVCIYRGVSVFVIG